MDRRSFVLSLFGGLAAAGLGGAAIAQAATGNATQTPEMLPANELNAVTKAALDRTDADFTQVVVRERTVVRRPRPAYRRPVVVRERVVVRRPAPRYRRPVVVRRNVIVR